MGKFSNALCTFHIVELSIWCFFCCSHVERKIEMPGPAAKRYHESPGLLPRAIGRIENETILHSPIRVEKISKLISPSNCI